ncbi:MAG: hypothetical protein ACYS9C_17415, partial [Planctomycetota bacterium]
ALRGPRSISGLRLSSTLFWSVQNAPEEMMKAHHGRGRRLEKARVQKMYFACYQRDLEVYLTFRTYCG